MIKFIVEGKRWFDKINGNTYHSVTITDVENRLLFCSGMEYGYGDQYRQTALDYLISKGLLDKKDKYNHELIREAIYWNVTDVNRKKDLDLEKEDNFIAHILDFDILRTKKE